MQIVKDDRGAELIVPTSMATYEAIYEARGYAIHGVESVPEEPEG